MGEDRPRPELEAALTLVEEKGARDVAGQEVRSELYSFEAQIEGLGKEPRDQRLRQPRIVLDQDVPIGQHAREDLLQHVRFPHDRLTERGEDILTAVGDGVDLHGRFSASAIRASSASRDGPRRRVRLLSRGRGRVSPASSTRRGQRIASKYC